MADRKKHSKGTSGESNIIAHNKKARFEYEVLDTFEGGMALLGSEVKSLRNRDVDINGAFVRPRHEELWLLGANIKPYAQATIVNHDPLRPRKILLHRREILRIVTRIAERGYTMVPLKMYWKRGVAKVLLGLVRGKRAYDKRETIKKRDAKRDMERALRRGNR